MMDANSANQIAQRFCCQDVDEVTEFPVRLTIGTGDYISFPPMVNPSAAHWSIHRLCGKISIKNSIWWVLNLKRFLGVRTQTTGVPPSPEGTPFFLQRYRI